MQNRSGKIFFTVLCVIFLFVTMAEAAKTLSVVSRSGANTLSVVADDSFSVEVIVDDAAIVAGASFTVAYDTSVLTLASVESLFFDTFVSQGIPTPGNQEYVTVDTVDYYSPLVANEVVGTGSMLAGARLGNGEGQNQVLFTLNFAPVGTIGARTISITQSTINNTDAGYAPEGEKIPYMVGIGDESDPYPTYDTADVTPVPLEITVAAFIDSDDDDLDDNWEKMYAPGGDLNYFGAGDKEGDGYSDFEEYLNRLLVDSAGNIYDPSEINEPGGPGYVAPGSDTAFLPAIYFLLLRN